MLATGDDAELIVRMFRLRPASNASIYILFSVLALLLMIPVCLWLLQKRREARQQIHAEETELGRVLARSGLVPREKEVFDRLVQGAGPSGALLSATSAEAFDRAVVSFLRKLDRDPEREDLLRDIRSLRNKLGLAQFRSGVPVATTRSIPANQPVMVTLPGEGREGKGHQVAGSLVASNEEGMTIRLAGLAPLAAGPSGSGAEVDVAFANPRDASYTFRSRALTLRERESAFLVVPHSASLTRVQKRGFARVDLAVEIKFRWIPQRRVARLGGSAGRLDPWMRETPGILTSISGGGIRLRTPARLAKGDYIRLILPFLTAPLSTEPCYAEVVRCRGSGTYGLRFEGINDRLQEAIIQYVRREELRGIQEESRKAEAGSRKSEEGNKKRGEERVRLATVGLRKADEGAIG